MNSSGVCSAEDFIQTLLDYLIDSTISNSSPSPTQQQYMAKQMHAVVLLYNYYHRKSHPCLEFLGFKPVCKLAGVLKPNLITHMTFLGESSDLILQDVEKQLSLTEKAVISACDISQSLDPSQSDPKAEGWPVSKVSVFLIDSKKEKCLLVFSSTTHGVWSLIEKDIDISNDTSHGGAEPKYINKRKRIIKKITRVESNVSESFLQNLAYSAVKGVSGISEDDLLILGTHSVYSLSKEKSSVRFYIMQCAESANEEFIQVPIKDVLDSLLGPLVSQSSFGWMVTPVVEYFHLLPYTGIISDFFLRESFSNSLGTESMDLGNVNPDGYQRTEKTSYTVADKNSDKSYENSSVVATYTNKTEACKQIKDNDLSTAFIGSDNGFMDKDGISVHHRPNKITTSVDSFPYAPVYNMILTDKAENANGNQGHVTSDPTTVCIDNVQSTVDIKSTLSQIAVRVLQRKIDKLRRQHIAIDEEISQCDKTIETIIAGGENDIPLKIESIIGCCGIACLRATEDSTYCCQPIENVNQKRLCEAILTVKNTCQELDSICYENNWTLPTYQVFPKAGGFECEITMKGVDFEISKRSGLHRSLSESRQSIAAQMLAMLRGMKHENP